MPHDHRDHQVSAGARYEESDAGFGPLAKFMFWLLAATGLSILAMFWMMGWMRDLGSLGGAPRHPLAAEGREIPPGPLLEARVGLHFTEQGVRVLPSDHEFYTTVMWRDRDRLWSRKLSDYGFVDRDAGVAHIPIERAMELVLQSGKLASRGQPKD